MLKMAIDKSDKNDTNNIIKKEYDNIQKRVKKNIQSDTLTLLSYRICVCLIIMLFCVIL